MPGATVSRKAKEEVKMAVYKYIELVGTSEESWEKAAASAVELAAKSLRELRVAEVLEQDITIEKGKVALYRTKVRLSFKYEGAKA
jgi:flavin-binding protein dodecin